MTKTKTTWIGTDRLDAVNKLALPQWSSCSFCHGPSRLTIHVVTDRELDHMLQWHSPEAQYEQHPRVPLYCQEDVHFETAFLTRRPSHHRRPIQSAQLVWNCYSYTICQCWRGLVINNLLILIQIQILTLLKIHWMDFYEKFTSQ